MLVFGIHDVVVKLCWLLRKSGFGCGGLKAEIGSEIKIMGFCGTTIFSTTVSLGKGWKGPSKGRVVPEVQENNIDRYRPMWSPDLVEVHNVMYTLMSRGYTVMNCK